jgi:hypothetical protein
MEKNEEMKGAKEIERGLHEHIDIEEKVTMTNATSHLGSACHSELVSEILMRVMLRLVSVLLPT